MGLFGSDEHTLYEPAASPPHGERPAAVTAQRRVDLDEEPAALGALFETALDAARRRKLLSLVLLVLGGGLTAAAVQLAPRSYRSSGEILVVNAERVEGIGNDQRQQLEWERQIRSHDSLDGIARDVHLNAAAREKLESALKLGIDQSTVSIESEWSDPEIARDIVQAATSRFIDRRYETEVAAALTRIKPLEQQVEEARLALERLDPSSAPPALANAEATPPGRRLAPPSAESEEARRLLPAARERLMASSTKLLELEGEMRGRVARIADEIAEKAATLGAAHPQMVALRLQLAKAREESPALIAARAAKSSAEAEVAELSRLGHVPPMRTQAPTREQPTAADEVTNRRLAMAHEDYAKKKQALDLENLKLHVAEGAFQSKYQVTRPPEVARSPTRPVGVLVGVSGVLATLLVVFALAVLRDRSVGLFFEAKHVRDRLKLPVLGDLSEADFAS